MNLAINTYQKEWFPEAKIVEPCLLELDDASDEDQETDNEATEDLEPAQKCHVSCEDYGQAIALPSYRAKRPNVDYFSSDLHIQMFNLCNTTINVNEVCLYDERHSGKGANAVCSLRWRYHCNLIKDLLKDGKDPPSIFIKVLDNCTGHNKSNHTMMLDSLLSLVLYDRVVNFYLIPGHSHMRADQVVSLCKKALQKEETCTYQNKLQKG